MCSSDLFTWSLNSCASQPRLAPRALRARRTLLGRRSLSTSDPPELLWSSSHLTLDPSNSSRISFHPCLASMPVTLGANPYLPTRYVLSTWWVLKQNIQHGPTGSILITFVIRPQFTHSNTYWVHVEYFQKVPTTEPTKGGLDLPTGSI